MCSKKRGHFQEIVVEKKLCRILERGKGG